MDKILHHQGSGWWLQYPIIYRGFNHPRWLLGISSINPPGAPRPCRPQVGGPDLEEPFRIVLLHLDEVERNPRRRSQIPHSEGRRSRWGVATQIGFGIFIPNIGEMIHFDSYFSGGLKPPTRLDGGSMENLQGKIFVGSIIIHKHVTISWNPHCLF